MLPLPHLTHSQLASTFKFEGLRAQSHQKQKQSSVTHKHKSLNAIFACFIVFKYCNSSEIEAMERALAGCLRELLNVVALQLHHRTKFAVSKRYFHGHWNSVTSTKRTTKRSSKTLKKYEIAAAVQSIKCDFICFGILSAVCCK